jgi:gluconolactonase
LWAWQLEGPGTLATTRQHRPDGGRLLANGAGYYLYDSLAVDSAGNVCVATIVNGGITVVPPDGSPPHHVPMPDLLTTNICFGGPGLGTAFVTLSSIGQLVAMPWERPGQPLHFLARSQA